MAAVHCPQFNPEQETIFEFLERFTVQDSEAITKAGEDGVKKAAVLVKALPVPVITDLQRRLKPTKLSTATFEQLKEKLTAQYEVKKSIVGASVQFLNRKQHAEENIENYARVLNDLASNCKYEDCCRDRLLRDAFISGLRSGHIVGGLLQDCEVNDKKTFNDCVAKAKLLEQITQDAQDIKPAHKFEVNKTSKATHSSKVPSDFVCIRCGTKGKHYPKQCFALKKTCGKCKRRGHLTKACKTPSSTEVKKTEDAERPCAPNSACYHQLASGPPTVTRTHERTCGTCAWADNGASSTRSSAAASLPREDEFYNFLG